MPASHSWTAGPDGQQARFCGHDTLSALKCRTGAQLRCSLNWLAKTCTAPEMIGVKSPYHFSFRQCFTFEKARQTECILFQELKRVDGLLQDFEHLPPVFICEHRDGTWVVVCRVG